MMDVMLNLCTMCRKQKEMVDHLFFHCEIVLRFRIASLIDVG